MNDFLFELGSSVRCQITGFKGIVRARAQYLTGCNRYAVQPKGLTPEGKMYEWEWFDEPQIELDGKKIITLRAAEKKNETVTGGPVDINHLPPNR